MLRTARDRARREAQSVQLVRADVGALPLADRLFDATVTVTVLCFMADSAAAVRELARTGRREGRWLEGRRRGGPWSLATFWSARGLTRILRAVGLAPRRVCGAVFYSKRAAAAVAGEPRARDDGI